MKNLWLNLVLVACAMSLFSRPLNAAVIGSQSAISVQPQATFLSSDNNNSMTGFAWFKNGFILQNSSTTCTFDSAFSVSGVVALNGGSLYLASDLIFDSGAQIVSFGNIYGNARKLKLPKTTSNLAFSSLVSGQSQKFVYLAQVVTAANSDTRTLESLDWSHDDKYITAVSEKNDKVAYSELKEITFDGANVAVLHSDPLISGAYAVRWHPYEQSFAVHGNWLFGQSSRIKIFRETAPGIFAESCCVPFYYDVMAFDWHPTGSYLAVGCIQSYPEIHVYPYQNGILNAAQKCVCDLSGTTDVTSNAVAWSGSGKYLVVGKCRGFGAELSICRFTENFITVDYSQDFNADVSAVDWLPSTDLIAVGFAGIEESNHIRLYSYNTTTKQLTLKSSLPESSDISSLQWSVDKTMLAAGVGAAVNIYSFNATTTTLSLMQTIVSPNGVVASDVRWSHNGRYILFGQREGTHCNAYVYGITTMQDSGLVLHDTILELDADLTVSGRMIIQGNCAISGNGNQLILDKNVSIEIGEGSTLRCENICVNGLQENNVHCVSSDGRLMLINCELMLSGNYSFSTGSIRFESSVGINGGYAFNYTTAQTSTVAKNANLLIDSGCEFNYAPIDGNYGGLVFEDKCATLIFNNSKFSISSSGLSLKKGSMFVRGIVCLNAPAACVSFGDGVFDNDFDCKIDSGAKFEIVQGALSFKNVGAGSLFLGNVQSILQFDAQTTFNLYQSCAFGNGKLIFEDGANFFRTQGMVHKGTTLILGHLTCGFL